MPRVVKVPRRVQEGDDPGVDEQPEYRLEPGDLMFDAKPVDLARRLRRIYDNARTTVEERGIITLHLSFGMLKWEDPLLGDSISPLWLGPCELQSAGPSAPLRLLRADEEMQLNPALGLYLRERHHVQLPSLPEEPTADSLRAFFEDVRTAIRDHGWKVEEEVWLSTFTFESLVIYQDLKALEETALRNQIIIALARASTPVETSDALGEERLDALLARDQVPVPVLPTDSSQLKALALVRAGNHLVVHGPPGTGKSQTIANLIADSLAENKKVLFVSAKMAALNVVHERLTQLGLERFCLEAHSTRAGKARVIEDLRRALEGAAQDRGEDLMEDQLQDLLRVRDQLNTYVRELHERRNPLGLSLYQAVGRVEKLRSEPEIHAPLPWHDPLKVTRSELNAALEALRDLASQADVYDARVSHPWRGLTIDPTKPIRREALEEDVRVLRRALQTLLPNLAPLGVLWDTDSEAITLSGIQTLAPALAAVSRVDRLPVEWGTRQAWELASATAVLEEAAAKASELLSKRAEARRLLKITVEEAEQLLAPIKNEFASWTRTFKLSYWRWRSSARRHLREGVAGDSASLRSYLELAQRIRQLDRWLDDHAASLRRDVDPASLREPEALTAAANRLKVAVRLRTGLASARLSPAPTSPRLTEDLRRAASATSAAAQDGAIGDVVRRIDEAWPGGFADGLHVAAVLLGRLVARCEELSAALPKINEWIPLQHTLRRCQELGLSGFLDALGVISAWSAPQVFERRFYTAWINALLDTLPTLVAFSGGRHLELLEHFRTLDGKVRRAALARAKVLASGSARRVASAQFGAGAASEVGILRRELEKRRRIKPLRKLFGEIPNVLQALKPCFLMSPLSVSTFLKPDAMRFDLVLFDEASQLPTPESIPAILRAGQAVVAGDRNQLPPTSFFEASVIFDEEGEEAARREELEPLESLLDDCVAIYPVFQQAHLRWHYRSRDERLIKFSNHSFYRDKPLITFPSPTISANDQGVCLVYVPGGVWDRGGSRTNRAEARRVSQLVIEQLEGHPDRSLGVVALNVTQREAIEETLDELILQRPDLASLLDRARPEPFFIKALENVQGDERDSMIISVGFGKGPTGALTFNFGPLNQEGGWRRLNVLITRARWQTILVTSLQSHELAGVNPNNRGAVALRDFIAYAERGGELPPQPPVVTEAETNDFEDAVAEALRDRGLLVAQQVGASEYRIDLAIRDPRDPSRYLLGVECDGATYHSAKTARDRDLLRQEVLRGQGWRLYRVWSTDWFRDREKATEGVLRAIQRALETPHDSVPAQTPPSPRPPTDPRAATQPDPPTGNAPAPAIVPPTRRHPPGERYRKYRESGQRDYLLDRQQARWLAGQIVRVVEFEGPIHRELLLDRLKEIDGIGRVGHNVEANFTRALGLAVNSGKVERSHGDCFRCPGTRQTGFRIPGDGVERPLPLIPREEIETAILHIVEDQFGYQRQALPRAVAEAFGLDRTPPGCVEVVGAVVDDLVDRKALAVSGPNVYLA